MKAVLFTSKAKKASFFGKKKFQKKYLPSIYLGN